MIADLLCIRADQGPYYNMAELLLRHHHILEGDDLAHDIADLLTRCIAVDLRELGQVDGINQSVEDGALDVVIAFRAPRSLAAVQSRSGSPLSTTRMGKGATLGSSAGRETCRPWLAPASLRPS